MKASVEFEGYLYEVSAVHVALLKSGRAVVELCFTFVSGKHELVLVGDDWVSAARKIGDFRAALPRLTRRKIVPDRRWPSIHLVKS